LHIVGSLTGALPLYPTQVDFSGVPLLLSPEEVYVLYKENSLQLIDIRAVEQQYTKEEIVTFKAEREEDKAQQVRQMMEHRQMKTQMFTQNKKQKVEERTEKDILELKGQELISIPTVPLKAIDTKPFIVEWQGSNWSKEDINKMVVFYDLWKKGFHLTNGSKFGGDFLAYPGNTPSYII
jgi:tRNA-splicing endonuclease subunit Sen34